VLLEIAAAHVHTIFAAHTHTQRAQPTTVAHYLLAVIEQLERDAERLRGAYARTNCSPLGACAITPRDALARTTNRMGKPIRKSRVVIDAPIFNLVLTVVHRRSTQCC
jgi:argininosuccinate lyase